MKIFNLIFALAICCCFVACSDMEDPIDQTELSVEDRTVDVCRRLLNMVPGNTPPNCNDNLGITIVDYDLSSGQCCMTVEFPDEGPWSWCMIGPQTGPDFTAPLVNVIGTGNNGPVYQYKICVDAGAASNTLIGFENRNTGDCQALDVTGC